MRARPPAPRAASGPDGPGRTAPAALAALVLVASALAWGLARSSGPPARAPSPEATPAPGAPEIRSEAEAAARGAAMEREAARVEPAPFVAHAGEVVAYAWSPDARLVATGARDGEARLWTPAGAPLFRLPGHREAVLAVAFSPDGQRVATASADGTGLVWTATGQRVARLEGHEADVVSVAFADGHARVLTTSLDGTARLWDAAGTVVATVEAPGGVASADVLPGGAGILVRGRTGGVRVVDLDGATLATLAGDAEGALGGPDGRRVLTWSGAEAVLWSTDGTRTATLTGHDATVLAAAFAPDGRRMATAALDGTVRLWTEDGAPGPVLAGHRGGVVEVVFLDGGARVLSLGSDGTARVWTPDGRAVAALGTDGPGLRFVAALPGGAGFVTGSREAPDPRLFDADGRLLASLPAPGGRLLDVRAAPDGRTLLARGRDLGLAAWPLEALGAPVDPEAAPTRRPGGPPGTMRGDAVGAAACAPCHPTAWSAWRDSAHRTTLLPPTDGALPQEALAGARVEHPPGWSTFVPGPEGMRVTTTGPDGRPGTWPVTWVSGARRLRMLVATMDDGRLQVLPAMEERPDGPWFDYTHLIFGAPGLDPMTPPTVAPGDPTFWTGPVRSFDARCAGCHASGREPREPGPGGRGPRSTWRAPGVDCEACHGAGRAHAEAWARHETDQTLLRIERLDRRALVEACTQCHMEGERLTPHHVIGDDVYEHLDPTLLVDPERVDPYGRPLELIYDGLPFATSRCAEAGGLTCSTCHRPHGGSLRSLQREPLADGRLCATCHAPVARDVAAHAHHDPGGSGVRCIGCHMPFLEVERGHGAVTDHTIGVPVPGAPGDRVARDACAWCHQRGRMAPDDAPPLDDEALRAAWRAWWPDAGLRGWRRALGRARAGAPDAVADLVAVLSDRDAPRVVRASAARLLGRGLPGTEAALLDAARDADGLVRRAALTALAGARGPAVDARIREALADPSRAVRIAAARTAIEPFERAQDAPDLLAAALPVLADDARRILDDDLRWFRLGAARELAGDLAGAVEAYARQTALDPFAERVRQHLERLRARLAEGR